jgi:hypothetical protein
MSDKTVTYIIPDGHLTINLTQLAKVLAAKTEQKLK